MKHRRSLGIVMLLLLGAPCSRAMAQAFLADDIILLSKGQTAKEKIRSYPHLAGMPGAGDNPLPAAPGADVSRMGEHFNANVPGVLSAASAPEGQRPGGAQAPRMAAPAAPARPSVPLYGPLELPSAEDEGPSHGLTLDAAIDLLVQENYDLRTKFHELPKAQADILSAGLRLNPLVFGAADGVPYGSYSENRPGENSYALTVIQPIDVNQKRRVRVQVAQQAKRVLEAQYQDAVRLQIDMLASAYVDVLDARETVTYARASMTGLSEVLKTTEALFKKGLQPQNEVERAAIQRDNAEVALQAAETALRQAKQSLATLLNISPETAENLELRGTLHDRGEPPPCAQELVRLALEARPDLAAYRLGVQRAQADVRLAKAERVSDVYALYTPYGYTNNAPLGKQSTTAWGASVLVSLPVFNRNQGNITRAQVNVAQTQTELAGLERQVADQVTRAALDYEMSRTAVTRYERDILPRAKRLRDNNYQLFLRGQQALVNYLGAQRDYNETVRQYLDAVIRHRRSMLKLNTAVGQRILP